MLEHTSLPLRRPSLLRANLPFECVSDTCYVLLYLSLVLSRSCYCKVRVRILLQCPPVDESDVIEPEHIIPNKVNMRPIEQVRP